MIKEAERQAELQRQKWAAEHERWKQEEDRRQVAQSIKESREQLNQVIQGWARVVSLEQFFEGVQSRAQNLPEEQQQEVLKRLKLSRDFVGTQGPPGFLPLMENTCRKIRTAINADVSNKGRG